MAKKLFELDPAEVSLVSKAANKRKFLIWKSKDGVTVAKLKTKVKKDGLEENPGLSDRAKAAIQAVVRILTPFKGEIKDEHLDEALDEAGVIEDEDGNERAGEVTKLGEDLVKDPEAYRAVQVNTNKVDDDEDQEDLEDLDPEDEEDAEFSEEDKCMKSMAAKMAKTKNKTEFVKVMKEFKQKTTQGGNTVEKQPVLKADGTLNLEAVPEEVRPAVEAIYKSQQELVKKNESLATELASERKERRTKEFVAKADGFKHFTGDRKALAENLMSLEEANKPLYEMTINQLEGIEAAKTEVAKSLTTELGSNQPSEGASEASAKIDAAVAGIVQKSSGEMTQAKAYDQFIRTSEGQKLYSEYKSNRKGGV